MLIVLHLVNNNFLMPMIKINQLIKFMGLNQLKKQQKKNNNQIQRNRVPLNKINKRI